MRYLLILLFLKSLSFAVCINPYENSSYTIQFYTSGYYNPANLGVSPLPDGTWSCLNDNPIKITQHFSNYEYYDIYVASIASNCNSPYVVAKREGLQYCESPKNCTLPEILNNETNLCETPETPPSEGDGDADEDGTPNKADPDYSNFSEMDMDGDGTNNGDDSDMDGDGTPNNLDSNPYDSSSSESCPVNNYMLNNVTSENCHIGSIDFLPTDGDVAYITYAQYDTCRNKCAYEYSYCPTDTVINNGECKPVEPPKGSCSGTTQCKTIGLGVNGIECIKNCYCITADNPTMTSENLYFSQTVSCDDTKTDKEKYEDLKNDNPTDTNTPDNPLADSNGSVDYNNAESVKAALQSYGASTELTSQKQLRELEIQSLQAVATNTKLDGLKSVVENFSAVSTSNQGVINGTLQGIKDGQNISNTLLGGINDGVGTTNELLTDIKGLLGDGNGTSGDGNNTFDVSGIENLLEGKNKDGTDSDISSLTSNFETATNLFDTVKDSFTNVANSYDSMTANINQGFNLSLRSGSDVSLTAEALGKTIEVNFCTSLSPIAPIFYYMFYVSFMFASIRLFYYGFKVV